MGLEKAIELEGTILSASRHNVSRRDIDKARSFIGSHKKELR
jgi:hypothetical protein